MAKKDITYNIIDYDFGDDMNEVTASVGITTNTINDLCGHAKITVGCDGTECDNSVCNNEDSCCSNPMIIHGDLKVIADNCMNGNISANNITANNFIGNGSKVTNTDDTKVTDFQYLPNTNVIKLTTKNNNDETSEKNFYLDTKDFTKDTKIIDFGYSNSNSNILELRDNNNNIWTADLSKYDDSQEETYINDGYCDEYGNIKLIYNQPYMSDINIDISKAIANLEHYVTDGFINNKTLVLKLKNGGAITIPLYDLIADLKYKEDKYIVDINWCGDVLVFKRSDGMEWNVSFQEILSKIVEDNINNIVGGCINQDNELILYFEDETKLVIGKIKDTNTFLTSATWKINPLYPDDPFKMVLRLSNNDGSNIDIKFGDLISRLDNDNTYITKGEIIKSDIILTDNNGDKIKIGGLVNTDTTITNGYYNINGQELVLKNNNGHLIRIDVKTLINECMSLNDKHLKDVKLKGDTIVFDVEGVGEMYLSLAKYKNIDQSIKDMKYFDGTLTITDMQNKENSVSGFIKSGDIKNIEDIKLFVGDDVNYISVVRSDGKKWRLDLPDASLVRGKYLPIDRSISNGNNIELELNNGKKITITNVENTYVNKFIIDEDTLRLTRNDNQSMAVKLTPILNIAKDESKILSGDYKNGVLTLNTKNDKVKIGNLPIITEDISKYELNTSWVGSIEVQQYGNVVNINIDINNNQATSHVIDLPLNLPFKINKVIHGMNNNSLTFVPIEISERGSITLTNVIPDSIKDNFTIITL